MNNLRGVLTRQLAALFDRMGYAVIPHWRLDADPQARYLRRLFRYLKIDCVLDVGANEGQFATFLRQQVGYTGQIVSFEPIPANAEKLQQLSRQDGCWTVHRLALGSAPGVAKFNITCDTVFSSFLKPLDDSGNGLFGNNNQVVSTLDVTVSTLDALLPTLLADLSAKSPYLKLDTQGFDLEVLRGAEGCLGSISALQTEASVKPIYRDMPGHREVIDHLTARGFGVSAFFPVSDVGFPELVEFDCHMVAQRMIRRR